MSLTVAQTYTAIGPGLTSSFQGIGGTSPYTYSVRSGGTGGTINSSGVYTAPSSMSENPATIYDVIQVMDSVGAITTASILVGSPLFLFCDIIQTGLGLATGRVFLWDQKIIEPTDFGLFVAVSVLNCKPFANSIGFDSNANQIQSVNVLASLSLDIISRGPAARDQKELVILALQSVYSQQQQEANSFNIARISTSFVNLSEVDGSAIPYRYNIGVNIQYFVTTTQPSEYFNTFSTPSLVEQA